jgi:phage shock protein A
LPNSDLVDEQARVRLRNVRTRYTAAAIRDWNQNAQPKIQSFYGRMQYGKALEEAQAFRRKWPESEKIQTTVTKVIIEINQRAQEKFDEIMKKVRQLRAEGKRTEADDWLGRIIRNFGIPKYVELAEAEMNR